MKRACLPLVAILSCAALASCKSVYLGASQDDASTQSGGSGGHDGGTGGSGTGGTISAGSTAGLAGSGGIHQGGSSAAGGTSSAGATAGAGGTGGIGQGGASPAGGTSSAGATTGVAGAGGRGSGGIPATGGSSTDGGAVDHVDGGGAAGDAPAQHPFVSTGAACINYPESGYRMFPYDPSIGGGRTWPTCTLNCTTVTPIWGPAGLPPLDQALPAGPCDDEGATCGSPVMTGWCPPCTNVGGPGSGYTCVCRASNWHCAVTSPGTNSCGPPQCIDPSLSSPVASCPVTWTDTQICACGICRDLCASDHECPSGHCNLNQVCRTTSASCAGPDECPATCSGLCAPAAADGGSACLWPSAIRYTLHHFDFRVTTPDGVEYSRASFATDGGTKDGGSTPPQSLLGVVTEAQGSAFKLDTCLAGTGCQPAVYSFRFCTDEDSVCGASTDIQVHLPVGKKVQVDWQLVAAVHFDVGTAFLAVHDQDDGVTRNALLLAGAGGMYVQDNATFQPDTLPFSFTLHRQNCGRAGADAAYQLGDDYTMIVARRDGLGQPLALATGQAGSLDYALPSGGLESAEVHCLSAVQPNATDDYWNWDFWLESEPTAPDGGAP